MNEQSPIENPRESYNASEITEGDFLTVKAHVAYPLIKNPSEELTKYLKDKGVNDMVTMRVVKVEKKGDSQVIGREIKIRDQATEKYDETVISDKVVLDVDGFPAETNGILFEAQKNIHP